MEITQSSNSPQSDSSFPPQGQIQIEITGNDPNDTNRKRIRVACDTCRQKKIKCNGTFPCNNCSQGKFVRECRYSERPVKKIRPVVKERPKKDKTTTKKATKENDSDAKPQSFDRPVSSGTDFESRLNKIENVVLKIADNMERLSRNLEHASGHNHGLESSSEPEYRDYSRTSSFSASGTTNANHIGVTPNKDHLAEDTNSILNIRPWDEFVGTHSISCIFSNDSLKWMENTLGPHGEEYLTPIRNLPLIFFSELKPHALRWVDPPVVDKFQRKKLLESPFPSDQNFVKQLLDLYYEEITMINILCDETWIRGLFASYYNNFMEPERKRRRFKLSELLIMTCVLLISLSCRIEGDFRKFTVHPHDNDNTYLKDYSEKRLLETQDTLLNNAIFYYQRVSVLSEGLDTIEGILLLSIYIESNWLTSFFNYIPIAVAIRFAQELGLHRAETYKNLSLKEQERRRRIWWFCYFFDIEFCFKSGKPPIINASDVTTNSDEDIFQYFKKSAAEGSDNSTAGSICNAIVSDVLKQGNSLSLGLNVLRLVRNSKFYNNTVYFHFSILLLTRIRSKSYHELFVASAQKKDFNEISNVLERLNAEMFELASYSSEESKPKFYNDPTFTPYHGSPASNSENNFCSQTNAETVLAFKMSYPFMIATSNSQLDDRILHFRNTSLDSARTILHLTHQWNMTKSSTIFSGWAMYFPVAAFLVISASILNHPTLEESKKDIDLLVFTSLNFFKSSCNWQRNIDPSMSRKKLYVNKILAIELIIRLMLRIVIKVYETATEDYITERNIQLKEYLEDAKSKFPEIFENHKEFTHKLMGVIGASPFGSSGDDYTNKRGTHSANGSNASSVSTTNNTPRNSSTGFVAGSPSYNPALSNIMNNDVHQGPLPDSITDPMPSISYALFNDYLENDASAGMAINQFNNLPNFFFDNNLGV
ncbi:HAL9 Halotolerance protein 9 [Candida maltosa Xu316]